MIKNLFIIGMGGFLGSISRYLVYFYLQKRVLGHFPMGTFTVNVLGCFFLGLLFTLAERENLLSQEVRLFLAVGFCGSFTTFSTFALENVRLQMVHQVPTLLLYTASSIALGFGAAYLGMVLGRG